jgi:protein-tyrosine phosphatase
VTSGARASVEEAEVQVKIYWIDGVEPGRLGIMPRPRGGDWLEDEIRSLKSSGVDVVASLLEREEMAELDITAEQPLCEANGVSYLSFPIRDFGVPPSQRAALSFANSLRERLRDGKSVVIHCRQGIGRSSLLAACVLLLGGTRADEAFRRIEEARGRPAPDTLEQREWVFRLAEVISA